MVRLVAGLGNPGPRYRGTRHNVGFELLDRLAASLGTSWKPWKDLGEAAEAEHPGGGRLWLLKPSTFMNLSGRMVGPFARQKGVPPEDVLVCFDEFALPLGNVRVRARGSAGGHNGMASVIEALGTEEVPRLRVGIGPVPEGADPAEFVLSRFRPDEKDALEGGMEKAGQALREALEKGVEAAMNAHNRK